MSDDTDRSLSAVLGYLVGRPLKLREILEALQMSRTRYYTQIDEDRLINADNLIRAAKNLDINEVDLLARYNIISDEAVIDYAESLGVLELDPQVRTLKRGGTTTAAPVPATGKPPRRKLSELAVRKTEGPPAM